MLGQRNLRTPAGVYKARFDQVSANRHHFTLRLLFLILNEAFYVPITLAPQNVALVFGEPGRVVSGLFIGVVLRHFGKGGKSKTVPHLLVHGKNKREIEAFEGAVVVVNRP